MYWSSTSKTPVVRLRFIRLSLMRAFSFGCAGGGVGGGAGAGGGTPAAEGPVAGLVELVVVEGGSGAPVPGGRAAAGASGGGAFGAGAFGGALVPPGVVEVGDRVAQVRLTSAVSPRTRRWMVSSRTPRTRAMRAEPWPITCRARSRSRVPPASSGHAARRRSSSG